MSWWKRLIRQTGALFGLGDSHGHGCNHDGIQLRQGTADFEWFIAKGELETGDNLQHGMSHLSNLLSFDPGRREWIELLDSYLQKADPDPEKLLPRGKELYYTTEAIRAYVYHRAGRLDDAVTLLANVTQAKPDARYLEGWVIDWLRPEGEVERLSDQAGILLFASLLNRLPEARHATVRRLNECRQFVEIAERFFAGRNLSADQAVMLRVGLLRRAGQYDDAVRIAQAAFEARPNWHDAVAVGLIWRAKGFAHQAEEWFRTALEYDSSDISARLEAGDAFFNEEHWEAALRWYEDALSVQPDQPWAKASALYCRWKRTGEGRFREELLNLMKSAPDNRRAHGLAYQAYMPDLPPPEDATANVLRQVAESLQQKDPPGEDAGPSEMKLKLSNLEAPSTITSFRLEMIRLGRQMDLKVTVDAVPQPDPRQSFAPVKYLLWKYNGTDPVPALPEPSVEIVDQISKLASTRFDADINWADASRLAAELGPGRVTDLLAVLTYPPDCPANKPALEWLPRVQMTVCQVIAHLDDGWNPSVRRDALYSLLLGPTDWTTTAAIQVIARIASDDEVHCADVHEAFQKLSENRPDRGFCCWERPLYSAWRQLPILFPAEKERIDDVLKVLDRESPSETG